MRNERAHVVDRFYFAPLTNQLECLGAVLDNQQLALLIIVDDVMRVYVFEQEASHRIPGALWPPLVVDHSIEEIARFCSKHAQYLLNAVD